MDPTSLLLVIALPIAIYMFIRHRKKKKTKPIISERKNKDEIWKSIKEYLRINNRSGYEIVDTFPIKRNDTNYVSPNASLYAQKKQRAQIKIRQLIDKQHPKSETVNKQFPSDAYVICFQLKDNKSNKFLPPEAFEANVIKDRNEKGQIIHKIKIGKTLDFNHEMEWIAPIRSRDLQANEKSNERMQETRYKRWISNLAANEKSAYNKNAKK